MQDDYNRFIRNSIKQAQCNYEDIFVEEAEAEETQSFCSMNVQSAQSNGRGCGGVQSERSNKCGRQTAQTANGGWEKVQSEQTNHCECEQMCRPVNELPVMVFIEMQEFGRMYNEAEGLQRGTMFPALDKPFRGGGCHC